MYNKGSSFLCCSCHSQQLSEWKGGSDAGLSSLAWMGVSSFSEQLHSPWELNKRKEMCPEVEMWHIGEQFKSSPFQLNHLVSFFFHGNFITIFNRISLTPLWLQETVDFHFSQYSRIMNRWVTARDHPACPCFGSTSHIKNSQCLF